MTLTRTKARIVPARYAERRKENSLALPRKNFAAGEETNETGKARIWTNKGDKGTVVGARLDNGKRFERVRGRGQR